MYAFAVEKSVAREGSGSRRPVRRAFISPRAEPGAVKPYPQLPDLDALPDGHFEGSVWIRELVAGERLRFGVTEGGYLRFAAGGGTFETDPPLRLRRAVGHVRRSFDVGVLLREANAPTELVFYGVATVRDGVEYDWGRLPPFLGFDVRDGGRGRWLPNDAVERAFEGLGLTGANAVEKELPVRHFYPERYGMPDSAWYGGPAAGVVVRDSHGNRAVRRNPDGGGETSDLPTEPSELASTLVTPELVGRLAAGLDEGATFDALFGATLDESFRLAHAPAKGWNDAEMRAFRGRVAERVREFASASG